MEIDNCVVCGKYLKNIGEQEQGMCNHCDNVTDAIAKEQDKALILPVVSFNEVELCEYLDKNNKCRMMCLTRCVEGNKFWE